MALSDPGGIAALEGSKQTKEGPNMTLNSSEQAPSVPTNSYEGWAVHSRAPPKFSFFKQPASVITFLYLDPW